MASRTAAAFGFEEAEASGFAALERRKDAEKAIVDAAVEYFRVRPLKTPAEAAHKALMAAVRSYNQAEADITAAQLKLTERAGR